LIPSKSLGPADPNWTIEERQDRRIRSNESSPIKTQQKKKKKKEKKGKKLLKSSISKYIPRLRDSPYQLT
jgi:hypothetical protein